VRIKEIANAEEQVGLLKLIMDKTWEALATQARQQSQQKASTKPPATKVRTPKATHVPQPKKLPAPPNPQQQKQPPLQQKPIAPRAQPTSQVKVAQPNKVLPTPPKPPNDSKDVFLPQRVTAFEKEKEGNDAHNKNTYKKYF
jgi:hypothetical protein